MNDERLLPCPFCGARTFLWRTFREVNIECSQYDARKHRVMVSADTEHDAIEAWNQRTREAKKGAERE